MAKIYNEVVIDMNPESYSYMEVLHEDSYEYNGNDMILAQGEGTTGHEGERATVGGKTEFQVWMGGVRIPDEDIEKMPTSFREGKKKDGTVIPSSGKKIAYQVIEYKGGQWVEVPGEFSPKEGALFAGGVEEGVGEHYANMDAAPTYAEGSSTEWGAANITKDMFVNPDGSPRSIQEIYEKLDPLLPGLTGDALVNQINEMLPKFQAVPEEEKEALAKEREFAERGAEMGRERDVYGLQQEAGRVGAQMRGAYGGMGGGMRGTMAGQAAMGKGMEAAYGEYGLGMEKAAFAEEKGLYGLEKGAEQAYESEVAQTLDPGWFTTPETGAQVTEWGEWEAREGGRVPDKESFSNFLTQLPDAGGS